MKTRFITGIIFLLVIIPLFFIESFSTLFFISILALIGMATYELNKLIHKENKWLYLFFNVFINYIGFYLLTYNKYEDPLFKEVNSFIILFVVFLFIFILYVFDSNLNMNKLGKNIFSNIYIILGFSSFYLIRNIDVSIFIYLFLITISTDVFAYLFGIKFGKHKITKISPKKSYEGSIGGSVMATILGSLYLFILEPNYINNNVFYYFLISFSLSIVGQIGDLVASKIKREHEIKDYSNLLPGHGGILDRFDSALLAGICFVIILFI